MSDLKTNVPKFTELNELASLSVCININFFLLK